MYRCDARPMLMQFTWPAWATNVSAMEVQQEVACVLAVKCWERALFFPPWLSLFGLSLASLYSFVPLFSLAPPFAFLSCTHVASPMIPPLCCCLGVGAGGLVFAAASTVFLDQVLTISMKHCKFSTSRFAWRIFQSKQAIHPTHFPSHTLAILPLFFHSSTHEHNKRRTTAPWLDQQTRLHRRASVPSSTTAP